ncbi:hypothetical protein BDN71DRAFT_1509049 [Pleurotus eryngii]|uniref:Uncharacterized protein n=1 Tax=Pleurotus eryngii TaxID=5323 RepID=A0A9P5ZS35_PLEER|nr:hypothetical protein BDN71DRAFT_1509049 [Pleurotus eryngii]
MRNSLVKPSVKPTVKIASGTSRRHLEAQRQLSAESARRALHVKLSVASPASPSSSSVRGTASDLQKLCAVGMRYLVNKSTASQSTQRTQMPANGLMRIGSSLGTTSHHAHTLLSFDGVPPPRPLHSRTRVIGSTLARFLVGVTTACPVNGA